MTKSSLADNRAVEIDLEMIFRAVMSNVFPAINASFRAKLN